MGWVEVWRVAMQHFAAEPVELRILIGLVAVFLALMVLVGLKHAFRPAAPAADFRLPEPMRAPTVTIAAAPVMAVQAPKPLRLNKPPLRAPRKAVKQTIKPFAPPRPKIQRVNTVTRKARDTEELAPFSPLPPHS